MPVGTNDVAGQEGVQLVKGFLESTTRVILPQPVYDGQVSPEVAEEHTSKVSRSSQSGNPARRNRTSAKSGIPGSVTAYQSADLEKSAGALKVLLDNNVWSHLADGHVSAEELHAAVREVCGEVPVRIVASPAVLNELLENPNDDSRTRAVTLISDPRWLRATREVEVWVAELVDAAERDYRKRRWVRHPPRLAKLTPHIDQ